MTYKKIRGTTLEIIIYNSWNYTYGVLSLISETYDLQKTVKMAEVEFFKAFKYPKPTTFQYDSHLMLLLFILRYRFIRGSRGRYCDGIVLWNGFK